jgi:uncharacterized protein
MIHYFIVPGLGNSGSDHWQTYFEQSTGNFQRIQQTDWDAPDCNDWIENIQKGIESYDASSVVLIGHSLGCTAIARWAMQYGNIIKGALLVGPSDIEAPVYTFPSSGFHPMPLHAIPFPTLVVASADDPWVSLQRAQYFADCWGSSLINIGNAGHINAASGYGPWKEGLDILYEWVGEEV